MVSSSAPITWQSWSRKWGDWAAWTRNVTRTRVTLPHTRVAPENLQRQIEKPRPSTKIASH